MCTFYSCVLYEVTIGVDYLDYTSNLSSESPGFNTVLPFFAFGTNNDGGLGAFFRMGTGTINKQLQSGAAVTSMTSTSGTIYYKRRLPFIKNPYFRFSPLVSLLQQTLVETSSAHVAGVNSINTFGPGLMFEWLGSTQELSVSMSYGLPIWSNDQTYSTQLDITPAHVFYHTDSKISIPLRYQSISGTNSVGPVSIQDYTIGVSFTLGIKSSLF
jgi:hypothetical protein